MPRVIQSFVYAALASSFITLTAPAAAAQRFAALESGQKIRVSFPSGSPRVKGVLVSRTADTLHVRACRECAPAPVDLTGVSRIDSRIGSRRTAGTIGLGALTGFLGGAGVGALIGYAQEKSRPPCTGSFCLNGLETAANSLIGAVAGTVVGAVIGSQIKRDIWQRVTQ